MCVFSIYIDSWYVCTVYYQKYRRVINKIDIAVGWLFSDCYIYIWKKIAFDSYRLTYTYIWLLCKSVLEFDKYRESNRQSKRKIRSKTKTTEKVIWLRTSGKINIVFILCSVCLFLLDFIFHFIFELLKLNL